ncbi:hypothetical protein KIW84_035378 [Lathyrus oleraceus]|uniref:Glycosyltransferase 2-like domain-containing protein n=1 Tax=Pisum sativum TaxID=3888 RepID=A0A9D4Y612_PEA|nr:hypothetical protein KIW84_035378 [Pisum sativum]
MSAGDAADQAIRQVDKMIKSGDRFARDARVGKNNQPSTQLPASGELSRKRPVPHDNEQLANGHEAIAKRIRSGPSWNDMYVDGIVSYNNGLESFTCGCNLFSFLPSFWVRWQLEVAAIDDGSAAGLRAEVSKWNQKGINIIYRHCLIRTGYKAGSLNSAMSCGYVKDYEYVAIFDADFQPNPDFLKKTVPHFKDNPELGLVQARWSYVNKNENLLTRLLL